MMDQSTINEMVVMAKLALSTKVSDDIAQYQRRHFAQWIIAFAKDRADIESWYGIGEDNWEKQDG